MIAPTTTFGNYRPFSTFDGDHYYNDFNGIGGPIDASFVALSTSTSSTTTESIASSPTATTQSTASTTSSSGASPISSEAGTNMDPGQDSSAKKGGLSTGAIAGIGAGAAVLVIAIAVLTFFFFWRRRKSRLAAAAAANNAAAGDAEQDKGAGYFKAELEDNPKPHGNELDGSSEAETKDKPHELGPGTERYELGSGGEEGLHRRVELP